MWFIFDSIKRKHLSQTRQTQITLALNWRWLQIWFVSIELHCIHFHLIEVRRSQAGAKKIKVWIFWFHFSFIFSRTSLFTIFQFTFTLQPDIVRIEAFAAASSQGILGGRYILSVSCNELIVTNSLKNDKNELRWQRRRHLAQHWRRPGFASTHTHNGAQIGFEYGSNNNERLQ